MKKFRDSLAGNIIILALICLVVTAALAFTNSATADIIKAQASAVDPELLAEFFPEVAEFVPLDIELPEGLTGAMDAGGQGYAFTATTKGYGGEIYFLIATDPEGNYIGIKMLPGHKETQGFGSRVAEPDYLENYYGQNSSESVDALSGATVTSGALKKALELANKGYGLVA